LQPPPLTDADERVYADNAGSEARRPEETVDVDFEETSPPSAVSRRP
jgi:hypothetical protein